MTPSYDSTGSAGTLTAGGDVTWLYCSLTNFGSVPIDPAYTVDLLGLSPEINLYEDIMSPTMYGNMVIVDTHNLISRLPIIGMETLFLGFRTPGVTNTVEKVFKVFKVSDRTITGNKQTYKLHFISNDAYADVRNSINGAFKGTPGQIIAQILTIAQNWDAYDKTVPMNSSSQGNTNGPGATYWNQGTTEDGATIETDQLNQVKFVSPQWSTFECIKWCEKMAVRDDGNTQFPVADYVFYESSQAYYFQAFGELFRDDPVDYFNWDHSQSNGAPQEMMIKIIDLRHRKIVDNLTAFLNRAYGQTSFNNDMFLKTLNTSVWSYHDTYTYNFGATSDSSTSILPEYPKSLADPSNPQLYNIAPDANIAVTDMNRLTHDLPDDYEKYSTLSRIPAFNFLEMNQIDIDIWGRSWLEVGDMININQGNYTQDVDPVTGQSLNVDDTKTSGNWLVTAIHHRLSPNQHKMTVQCVRNSTEQAVTPLVAS